MANSPCPECGSYSQKETFVIREIVGANLVDVYEIECRECGEVWDDESLVQRERS